MARIRTVKPEVAKHELLFEIEQELRLPVRFAWALLPTQCDREGRFKWRPRTLKADLLPYDECDFSRVLDAWVTRGLLVRYRVRNEWFGWIPTFRKHQLINPRESASQLPSVTEGEEVQGEYNHELAHASVTRQSRVHINALTRHVPARGEGKGRSIKNKNPQPPSRGLNGADAPAGRKPRQVRDRSRTVWQSVTVAVDRVKGTELTWNAVSEQLADPYADTAIESVGGHKLIADRTKHNTKDLENRFRHAYEVLIEANGSEAAP